MAVIVALPATLKQQLIKRESLSGCAQRKFTLLPDSVRIIKKMLII
jgi:hypothetical protein